MIQEMEAWFISQPQILDKYYQTNLSSKLPKTSPKSINKPVLLLENLTKNTKKGKYHKIKHGTALLEMLNANTLQQSFSEFKEMVQQISK